MSDKAYLTLTAGAAAVFTALITLAGWSWWLGPLACLPVVLAGLIVKRRLEGNRSHPIPPPSSYPPPPPAAPQSTRVQGLVLPSKDRDYRFLLHGTVLWRQSQAARGDAQHPRPAQLAVDAIRKRATGHSQDASPADYDLLSQRLATDLSFPTVDRSGAVEVWAQDVVLCLPDADLHRLRKLADVRKDEDVWEHERAHERNKRAYLRNDVFSSTGSAVVWWLSQDPAKVEQAVALIGTLAQLTAAANDREVDPVFRPFVDLVQLQPLSENAVAPGQLQLDLGDGAVEWARRLMAEVLPDGTEPDRAHLADQLAGLVASIGADKAAREIRVAFNAPDFAENFAADLAVEDPGDEYPGAEYPAAGNGRTQGRGLFEPATGDAMGALNTAIPDPATPEHEDGRPPQDGFSER